MPFIDKEATLREMENHRITDNFTRKISHGERHVFEVTKGDMFGIIHRAPEVDAVLVVRCKNCGKAEWAAFGSGYLVCNRSCMFVYKNDYCSYGIPRMGGDNNGC